MDDKVNSESVVPFTCVLNAWEHQEAELRHFLQHHLSNRFLAEDLVQEVFIKEMAKGKGFCALDNPRV